MNRVKTIFIITCLVLANITAGAQSKSDIEQLEEVHTPPDAGHDHGISFNKDKRSVLGSAFRVYKRYISSQDASHCVFYPSCSVYAVKSIQNKGAFMGMLAAFDRLIRCHGFSQRQYPIHNPSGHLHDPVE